MAGARSYSRHVLKIIAMAVGSTSRSHIGMQISAVPLCVYESYCHGSSDSSFRQKIWRRQIRSFKDAGKHIMDNTFGIHFCDVVEQGTYIKDESMPFTFDK